MMDSLPRRWPKYADRCRKFEERRQLTCYVCPKSLQNKNFTWDKHVKDPLHLSMLDSFNKSFCETQTRVICKLCSKSFFKYETVAHAISHQFSPWYKPEDLYCTFVKNYIAPIENEYYCHLCEERFSFWHVALGHVIDPKHQLLLRDKITGNIRDESLCISYCESLIYHNVFPKTSSVFECMVCNRFVSGHANFEQHINGRAHRLCANIFAYEFKDTTSVMKQKTGAVEKVSVRKHKKEVKKKCDGSTGSVSISRGKQSPKKQEQKQIINLSGIATGYAHEKVPSKFSSNNVKKKMTLGISSSGASPVSHKPEVHGQLKRVIYKPKKNQKAQITCRKCNTKVRDHVELHVHLTSHFWPRFIANGDGEVDQPDAFTDENIPNESNMIGENETREQSCPRIADAAPLQLSELIKQLGNFQPFSSEIGKSFGIRNEKKRMNGTVYSHLISFAEEQQAITDRTKKQPEPLKVGIQGTSKLQFLESLNKQLAPNFINPSDERDAIDEWSRFDRLPLKPHINKTSPSKEISKFSEEVLKTSGDFQCSKQVNDHIYQIDNKQLKDIKLGIILSFTRDGKNIYCMICRENIENSIQNVHEHLCNDKHNNYLEQIQQDHLRFSTFPELFSDLHLALQFMEETSDLYVQCWACEEVIQNDPAVLKQHMESNNHKMKCMKLAENSAKLLKPIKKRMTRDWYNVQNYWCVVCGTLWPSEFQFMNHLDSLAHIKRCHQFRVFENLIYDFCPTCATLWLGFRCTFAYHCQCKMHIYHLRDNFYHVTELPTEAKKFLKKWPHILEDILKNMKRDMETDKSKEQRLLNDLLEVAREEFIRAKVYPFGSRVSGLAQRHSDLGVFVDCNNTYFTGNSKKMVEHNMKVVEECLKKHPKTWKIDRSVIENVRIPIIKVHHRPTDIECDISFSNGLTVEKTQLIRSYIEMYPQCRDLIIFMKKWTEACDLGAPGLTSFAIACMVIYFLQDQGIVPSVAELIRLKGESRIIAGWQTGVETNFHVQDSKFHFIQLVRNYFITYSQFDYRNSVICPLLGRPIKKCDFLEFNLPDEMAPYELYISNQMISKDNVNNFCINAAICVQDPFDLTQNLTKNVKKFLVHRFRVYCSKSAEMLS